MKQIGLLNIKSLIMVKFNNGKNDLDNTYICVSTIYVSIYLSMYLSIYLSLISHVDLSQINLSVYQV